MTSRRDRLALWARLALRPLALYVASRLVVVVALAVAAVVSPERDFNATLLPWDSGWYLHVAAEGYPDEVPMVDGHAAQSTIAFFPLFPLAVRAVSHVPGLSLKQAALLAGGMFGALAAVALWLLTRRLAGTDAADRATALFCFFPASFVLSMPYSEALMISLAIACLTALVSHRWLVAGVAAGLATATRPNAIALVAACGWEAARALRRREYRAVAAPLLAPTGIVAFLGFLWARTGQASAWMQVQQDGWGERFDFGRASGRKFLRLFNNPTGDINELLTALGLVFIVVTGVLLLRSRLPSVLPVYTAVIVVLAVGTQTLGARPRFLLTAFPLLIAAALRLEGLAFTVTVGCSATLLGAFTILSTGTIAATP